LSLFTGSNLPTLALVEANDDEPGHGLTSGITRSFTAGQTYQIAVDGFSSSTGPIRLSITPGTTGSPYAAGNLTETANNTLKQEANKDPLTGNIGGDTLMLPFAESSVSPSPDTGFALTKQIDLVTEGGASLNAPSLFSPVSTLVKDQSPVLMEPNGALAGNAALKINSDAFGLAQTSPFADDPYLFGLSQAKPLGI
jgi:hypothetical protein